MRCCVGRDRVLSLSLAAYLPCSSWVLDVPSVKRTWTRQSQWCHSCRSSAASGLAFFAE